MSETQTRDATFFSGPSVRMAATIYLPDAKTANHGGIVFCHGFGGVRGGVPVGLSLRLAAAGYTVMAFDYRGFGQSDGHRALLSPADQVEDTVHALEFLAQYPGVDKNKIGLYGTSFGGGVAALAAARSPRPKALVMSVPVVSGTQWLRSLNRWYEFEEVKEKAFASLAKKVLTGEVEIVDRSDIMIPDPLSRIRYAEKLPMTQETVYHLLNHEPLDVARKLRMPVKMFGVRDDSLVPYEQTEQFFQSIQSPKDLTIFDRGNHWAVYDEALSEVATGSIAWFGEHVLGAAGSR